MCEKTCKLLKYIMLLHSWQIMSFMYSSFVLKNKEFLIACSNGFGLISGEVCKWSFSSYTSKFIYVYLPSCEEGGYMYKVVTWWMKCWDSGFDIAVLDTFAFLSHLLGFGIDLTLGLTRCRFTPWLRTFIGGEKWVPFHCGCASLSAARLVTLKNCSNLAYDAWDGRLHYRA